MALLLAEGFEHGLVEFAAAASATVAIESASPINGDYSLAVSAVNAFAGGYISVFAGVAAANDDGIGAAFNVVYDDLAANDGQSVLAFTVGTSSAVHLQVAGDGSIVMKLGTNVTTILTSTGGTAVASSDPGVLSSGMAAHVAVLIVPGNSPNGSIQVAVNGELVIDETGIDTLNSTASANRDVNLMCRNSNAPYVLDDLLIFDDTGASYNTLPAPMKAEPLRLDGQVSAQFVGSDGNSTDNHLLLDEHPVSNADYVESSTLGETDLYTVADRVNPGDVQFVRVVAVAENPDGGANSLDLVLESGATTENSAAKGLGASETVVDEIWETDPNTAAAWTGAAVDALEVGFETA